MDKFVAMFLIPPCTPCFEYPSNTEANFILEKIYNSRIKVIKGYNSILNFIYRNKKHGPGFYATLPMELELLMQFTRSKS